jgi:hypothetical protein
VSLSRHHSLWLVVERLERGTRPPNDTPHHFGLTSFSNVIQVA